MRLPVVHQPDVRQPALAALMACLLSLAPLCRAEPVGQDTSRLAKAVADVQATPETADDLALAAELFREALTEGSEQEATVRLTQAIQLALTDPAGTELAMEIMPALKQQDPHGWALRVPRLAETCKTLYEASAGQERIMAGETLIRILLEDSAILARQGRAEAADRLDEAQGLAETIDSEAVGQIAQARTSLEERIAAGQKLQSALESIQQNPADATARQTVVELLLVHFDDPNLARRYLGPDVPEMYRSYVPLAAQGPLGIAPEVVAEVGLWYAALAEANDGLARIAMFARAKQFLLASLKHYEPEDAEREQIGMRIQAIEKRLQELGYQNKNWTTDTKGLMLPGDENIRKAIQLAREYLLEAQKENGSWEGIAGRSAENEYPLLPTAVITYALLDSGMSAKDPRLAKALEYLVAGETNKTMTLAFRLCALQACRQELRTQYRAQIRADIDTLYRSSRDGSYTAICDLSNPTAKGNTYYTGYALLGAAHGARAGVDVPRAMWMRSLNWWRTAQNENGGWGLWAFEDSAPAPTVTGAVSMLVCMEQLGRSRNDGINHPAVRNALAWIDERFMTDQPTDRMDYLYQLSRLGTARGQTRFDGKEWYRWYTKELLEQQGRRGTWRGRRYTTEFATAMGILCLNVAEGGNVAPPPSAEAAGDLAESP